MNIKVEPFKNHSHVENIIIIVSFIHNNQNIDQILRIVFSQNYWFLIKKFAVGKSPNAKIITHHSSCKIFGSTTQIHLGVNYHEHVPPPNVRTIVTHQIIVDFLVHGRFKLMSLNERTSLTSWSIIEIAMVEGITNNNEKMICILRKWFRSPLIIGECVNQLKINDITFQKRSRFV